MSNYVVQLYRHSALRFFYRDCLYTMASVSGCLILAMLASLSYGCKSSSTTSPIVPPRDTAFTITNPFFSLEGDKILFLGNVFGYDGYDLYAVDTAGGKATMLMRDSLAKLHPRLSPDGKRIAYLAAGGGRLFCCSHLWVMNADGSNPVDCTPFGGYWRSPRWSPDSRHILAFGPVENIASGRIFNQIVQVNADGTNAHLLTQGDSGSGFGTWSHDGSKIFYVTQTTSNLYYSEVYVMNSDGSHKLPLDSTHEGGSDPRPSPTRNELLLLWKGGTSVQAGFLMNYDTSALPTGPASFRRFLDGFITESEWSPDGEWIAQRRGVGTMIVDIYIIRRSGAETRQLTRGYDISSYSWSRDSRYIVIHSISANELLGGFFIIDILTSGIRKLTITR